MQKKISTCESFCCYVPQKHLLHKWLLLIARYVECSDDE